MTAWLADVLRDAGLKVTTYGIRGRSGDYEPHGVLNHHTATKSSPSNPAPTLRLVVTGRSDLPGPLCQVLLGADGHCHVITTGRANHAGNARATGPMPAGDGNELYVGIEWDYSGYDKPTPAQYAAGVKANAAILTRMRRPATYARGHRETSTTGKWDPGQVDLDALRTDIAQAMTKEDEVTPEDIKAVAAAVWSHMLTDRAADPEVTRSAAYLLEQTRRHATLGLSQDAQQGKALAELAARRAGLSDEDVARVAEAAASVTAADVADRLIVTPKEF